MSSTGHEEVADEVVVSGLRLRCMIGFSAHELRDRQDVVVDYTIVTDTRAGADADEPSRLLVNYRTVNKAVIAMVEASHYRTLEALTTAVARTAVGAAPAMRRITVRVSKPGALRFTDNVAVRITRTPEHFKDA